MHKDPTYSYYLCLLKSKKKTLFNRWMILPQTLSGSRCITVYFGTRGYCIRQPVSLLFSPLSSFWSKEKMRMQQGNYLPACFIQLASDTNISHATRITTLWLKQLICFILLSQFNWALRDTWEDWLGQRSSAFNSSVLSSVCQVVNNPLE